MIGYRIILHPGGEDVGIYKDVSMPALPRMGEEIIVDGNQFEITCIQHDIDKSMIEVDCNIDGRIAEYYEKECGWKPWPIGHR